MPRIRAGRNARAIRYAQINMRCIELLAEMDEKFPDDASRLREIVRVRDNHNMCKFCKGEVTASAASPRLYNCRRCRKRASYTSETVFCRVKCLRAWLAAITFIQAGVAINRSQFSRLLDIAYATAHAMFAKLSFLIARHQEQLADVEEVNTANFQCAFGHRSRLTPADSMPSNEEYSEGTPTELRQAERVISDEEKRILAALAVVASGKPLATEIFAYIKERGQPNRANVVERFSNLRSVKTRTTGANSVDKLNGFESDRKDWALFSLLGDLEDAKIVMRVGQFRYAVYDKYFVDPNLPCICRQKNNRRQYCPYHWCLSEVEKLKSEDSAAILHAGEVDRVGSAARVAGTARTARMDKMDRVSNLSGQAAPSACEKRYIDFLTKHQWKFSRKYSQLYLSLIWYFFAEQQTRQDIGADLLIICVSESAPTSEILRSYNTFEQVLLVRKKPSRCA